MSSPAEPITTGWARSTVRVALQCVASLSALTACSHATRSAADSENVRIGYGTLSRQHVTGAIGSVTPTRHETTRTGRVEELLEGRLSGVDVRRLPGGEYSVQVRGGATVLGGGAPLYVIDGIALPRSVPARAALAGIDPGSITRIDVLKGASSSAFGARGANGVILITTRHAPRY